MRGIGSAVLRRVIPCSVVVIMGLAAATPLVSMEEVKKYQAEPIYNEQGQVIAHKCKGDCGGGLCCTVFPHG